MASSSELMRVRTRVLHRAGEGSGQWAGPGEGSGERPGEGEGSGVALVLPVLLNSSHLLLLVTLTLCPGTRILPFFSQTRCGSGTPWATQVNTALPPAGFDTDCGH